jgi:hypothetical protein
MCWNVKQNIASGNQNDLWEVLGKIYYFDVMIYWILVIWNKNLVVMIYLMVHIVCHFIKSQWVFDKRLWFLAKITN